MQVSVSKQLAFQLLELESKSLECVNYSRLVIDEYSILMSGVSSKHVAGGPIANVAQLALSTQLAACGTFGNAAGDIQSTTVVVVLVEIGMVWLAKLLPLSLPDNNELQTSTRLE